MTQLGNHEVMAVMGNGNILLIVFMGATLAERRQCYQQLTPTFGQLHNISQSFTLPNQQPSSPQTLWTGRSDIDPHQLSSLLLSANTSIHAIAGLFELWTIVRYIILFFDSGKLQFATATSMHLQGQEGDLERWCREFVEGAHQEVWMCPHCMWMAEDC
ncbi:uncharacterized protein LACBIDRAFT_326273 [Laccaria bicolor S238N-H82]|uniref:Predicted protein n=1 Tax=Laccaria bicolor (strain S238N-H82 / ATCC MYA-4686) TaxID=486041 RepID=B0D7W6_LACBS|nr:uncharacterized protein LACBIDRAFT_326273 [Laccaria bicolor S238N-H82]EDR09714.1 predicted protein [Laccaria bicolor S238N-H82]|eukprot:XP_001880063.1 predicted protein [Laccaria bicolor S238N-H82]